ncbi:hypothetical protein VTN02DRAFT_4421 [Thermoascus thermophilus]
MPLDSDPFHLSEYSILSLIWRLALIFIILINFKGLPFVWHIRILRGFRLVLRSNRRKDGPTPAQLFQPLIISSRGSIMEMDYNLHKSNSTYFADLDVARAHLICTLFSRGIDYARNTKCGGIIGVSDGMIGLALGAVSCSFRKEVRPLQPYELWTRILAWDQKWIYVVTHFVRKDAVRPRAFTLLPGQAQRQRQRDLKDLAKKEDAIFASGLSKCVWKKGRRTIPPELFLQVSGLLPPRPGQDDHPSSMRQEPLPNLPFSHQVEEFYDIPFKIVERIEMAWDALTTHRSPELDESSEDGLSMRGPKALEQQKGQEEWTWERIETERQRGMEIANRLMELDRLHGEFTGEADALGMQRDLW